MREINQLHPMLRKKLKEMYAVCKEQGLPIGIGECLRTVEEQNKLYAKGRTEPGRIVTKAKGTTYSSMHQWGVAFDFYRNDGRGAYEDGDGFFAKVGQIGKKCGLEWGGDWKSIVDKPHFQLPDWGSTPSVLKSKYGTPERFIRTWPAGGWRFDGKGWQHRRGDGNDTKSDWELIDGCWYWFDQQGYAVEKTWISYKGNWYYLGVCGKMATGRQTIDGKLYHFLEGGEMETSSPIKPGA